MFFYVVNLITMFIYSIGFRYINIKNRKKILTYIYIFHFTVISGFRAVSVGTDTYIYQGIFNQSGLSSAVHILQNSKFIGYELLMKLVAIVFNNNYNIFLLIIAFLTNFFIFYTVYKINDTLIFQSGYLYYVLYYFISTMNTTRQMFAISLCVLSIYYLIEKKKIRCFLLLTSAFFIHATSLTVLVFPLLYKVKWSGFKYILLATSTILFGRISSVVMGLFSRVLRGYSIYDSATIMQSQGNRVYLTLFLCSILLLCIFISFRYRFSKSIYFFQAILIISFVIGLLFARDSLVIRAQQYFEIVTIVYFPLFYFELKNFLRNENLKSAQLLKIIYCIFLIILIVPFFIQLHSNYGEVIPYSTFLNF